MHLVENVCVHISARYDMKRERNPLKNVGLMDKRYNRTIAQWKLGTQII